jgi:type I restriction enzyme, S subunit
VSGNGQSRTWDIPPSWVWTSTGEVADVVGGGTPRTDEPENFEHGEVPWVTPADLSGYTGKLIERGARNITQRGLATSGARLMPKGSVLFSSRAPIGYVAVAANPISTNQGFKSFVLPSGISPDYVYYYLKAAKDLAVALASGTTFLEISGAKAKQIALPLAPEGEQSRIVAEIENQFTRLDAAVTALKRVQANLKRYRAAVLKAACEGRLVMTEAELARKEGRSYETGEQLLAHILKERRTKWEADKLAKMIAAGKLPKDDDWKKRYEEPEPQDTAALPSLPKGWIWTNLDQIICVSPQNGLYKAAAAYGAGTPILRIDDYQVDSCKSREDLRCLRTSADEDTLYALAQGDIVLNRVNSPSHLGKCTVVNAALCPCVFESNMMRFRVSDLIDPEWLTTVLQTTDGKARLTANAKWAVNQASINQQDVKQTAVPLPPIAEQVQILASVRQQLSINLKVSEELDTTSRHADRLRQSILKRAFEGKLVPQDPNDEPASVLLERIRAERAATVPGASIEPRRRSRRYLAVGVER